MVFSASMARDGWGEELRKGSKMAETPILVLSSDQASRLTWLCKVLGRRLERSEIDAAIKHDNIHQIDMDLLFKHGVPVMVLCDSKTLKLIDPKGEVSQPQFVAGTRPDSGTS